MKQELLTRFGTPSTASIKYHWQRNGVTYTGIMATPKSPDDFVAKLLERKISIAEVKRVEGIGTSFQQTPVTKNFKALKYVEQ